MSSHAGDVPDSNHLANNLKRLERQLERGGLFTHTALSNNADRLNDAEAFLYGLVDLLIEKGLLTPDELSAKAQAVRQELQEKGQAVGPGVALRVDNPQANGAPAQVNCAARLHICQAVCCKLGFALSAEEVESGLVKWDLGQPYFIRHEADGHCSHIDRETHQCGIYDNRPGVCRGYSCRNDERVWTDFDNMILNDAWINEHLADSSPRLARASMIRIEDIR
jgi:Fe-S-cluster containining protein